MKLISKERLDELYDGLLQIVQPDRSKAGKELIKHNEHILKAKKIASKYVYDLGFECGHIVNILPEELWDKILEKHKEVLEQNRKPQHLVMWEGYKAYFNRISTLSWLVENCIDANASDAVARVLGMQICWTEIPETLEVY